MKLVAVEDLWPGDVYKPYKNGPVRRIVSIGYVQPPYGRAPFHVRISGDGFDEFMYMTDVVWRLP